MADRVLRTFLRAQSAAYTFFLIDMRKEVGDRYRLLGAFLCTQSAADTTGLTYLHDQRTLVLINAVNHISRLIRYHLYQVLGTLGHAFAACLTLILIDTRHTVRNTDRSELAHAYTGA